MIRRAATALTLTVLAVLAFAGSAAAVGPCEIEEKFKGKCFGLESVSASLSTTEAGAHPDFTYSFDFLQDPTSKPDGQGLYEPYAPLRNLRTELPPGLIGNPNVLGVPQQCTSVEFLTYNEEGGGCPNGSQIGVATVTVYDVSGGTLKLPIYMMAPPGGDVVARVGFVAVLFPIYVDLRVRSEGDYGVSAEVTEAQPQARVIGTEATLWGVPSDESHDKERCTPNEVISKFCKESAPRPPGTRDLPFLTNPTLCGVPLSLEVSAASWAEERFDSMSAELPPITGCNKLPFGPSLTMEPTTHVAASPSGADVTIRLPASAGVDVLEPSQIKDIRVTLPEGISFNAAAADGLATCSPAQVHFKERVAAECPDAAKMADTEFDIPVLSRKLKGAIYLREPEPGHLFRIWVTADDLGLHVKLPGELEVNEETGQITTVTMDVPQAPVREARLEFKSGFRAPLFTPQACGEYRTTYEIVPWAGGPPLKSSSPMQIDEGCDTGGFSPELSAGSTDSRGGAHSPFTLTINREDGEDNLAALDVTLPRGMSATFAGIPRCEGAAAESGQCPANSRIGHVTASTGVGRAPLWVPQPGKRPTAVYLGGPYRGAPLSIVTVVPAQAGPFDLGDQVVRSAVFVDPVTAEATTMTDPLPQFVEGVPVLYRTVNVELDRPGFALNPTSCARKATTSTLHSTGGKTASPSSPFAATDCANLAFKPKISFRLFGGTHRGSHPKLRARLKMPAGGANIAAASVALPHSAFLDQAHIRTVCTRVQFAADACPEGAIYGFAKARTPLLDETLEGPVYLRSSSNPLPDMVVVLKGPASLPVEINLAGRVDSVNGGIRTTFDASPDAPVSEFTLEMQGGKKGLIVNSTNLCASTNRVTAKFTGHNGKKATLRPALKSSCGKRRAAKHRRHR